MNSETKNIIITTYPKITFVITRYVIEKAVRIISFHEMFFSFKLFKNKKHIRLTKNQVRLSVKINGSISNIGKYNPRNDVYMNELLFEEYKLKVL